MRFPSRWGARSPGPRNVVGMRNGRLLPAARALLIFGVFTAYPFVYAAWLSLLNWDGFTAQQSFIGLANYGALLADPDFWNSLQIARGIHRRRHGSKPRGGPARRASAEPTHPRTDHLPRRVLHSRHHCDRRRGRRMGPAVRPGERDGQHPAPYARHRGTALALRSRLGAASDRDRGRLEAAGLHDGHLSRGTPDDPEELPRSRRDRRRWRMATLPAHHLAPPYPHYRAPRGHVGDRLVPGLRPRLHRDPSGPLRRDDVLPMHLYRGGVPPLPPRLRRGHRLGHFPHRVRRDHVAMGPLPGRGFRR